tara:strand:- start:187 stop:327 length:141 start_codon:yes stop_codon:yes gene_type:complete
VVGVDDMSDYEIRCMIGELIDHVYGNGNSLPSDVIKQLKRLIGKEE